MRMLPWALVAGFLGAAPGLEGQSIPTQGTVKAVIIPMVAGARRPALTADLVHHLVVGPAGGAEGTLDDGLSSYMWRTSQGTFRLEGEVLPALAAADNPRGVAARPHRALERLLKEAVTATAAGIDLSRFDNNGPDGIPSSEDDDGDIDLLIVTMEAPVGSPEAAWIPTKIKVKTSRGDRMVRGVLYVLLAEDGRSPARQVAGALLGAMGVPGEHRAITDAPDEPIGTASLVSLGWREALRVERSGVYQPSEDRVLGVPLLDVPDERGRWMVRQVGHETDLIRVYVERSIPRIVEHHRVSAEHQEVTIPLTHRQGIRGARMILTWPGGPDQPPELAVELTTTPGRMTLP